MLASIRLQKGDILHAMQSTTLTCCLDDPVLTNSLAEFLLQIQMGYCKAQ